MPVRDAGDPGCIPEKYFSKMAVMVYFPQPKKPSLQPDKEKKRKSPYTPIPYRCLIPKGIDNLIVAGRCISVERPVLGPIRVMAPCIAMGEAAGYATKLALNDGGSYKNVDTSALREKILQKGGMLNFN